MKKYPRRDDSLPHQIRLEWCKDDSGNIAIGVTCTCMPKKKGGHEPIGYVYKDQNPWPVYNDPVKHKSHVRPFYADDQGGDPMHWVHAPSMEEDDQ